MSSDGQHLYTLQTPPTTCQPVDLLPINPAGLEGDISDDSVMGFVGGRTISDGLLFMSSRLGRRKSSKKGF